MKTPRQKYLEMCSELPNRKDRAWTSLVYLLSQSESCSMAAGSFLNLQKGEIDWESILSHTEGSNEGLLFRVVASLFGRDFDLQELIRADKQSFELAFHILRHYREQQSDTYQFNDKYMILKERGAPVD
ncbi:hypothetical protein J6TS7_29620 [Paenibacillus dendritiformis]|uniref:hypothetical protein n=1 Tax=Paenibacillus TaxID=44249 RepID=UPI001B0F5E3D|nr:hypothetical protein [Paenibacillus dendritiformis]GIO79352.1 hypothetical protein J6TS7_29620 [Paenibacillus dendritiformis]